MDWNNVEPDVYMLLDRDFTRGRDGSVKAITLHHNAGNLSIEDCYNLWEHSETSAHYQVEESGRIGQLVNDSDTAWACGDWWANCNTISIEHANDNSDPWTVGAKTLDAGAHLVAALCRYYGLGKPEWMVNVFPHSHWSATACPGELAGSQNAEYMARAQAYYDDLNAQLGEVSQPDNGGNAQPSGDIPPIRYRARVGGEWLPEMVNRYDTGGSGDDFAGNGQPMEYLAMDFPGWYQVCTQANGWLPVARAYNVNDLENGCAGDGSPILAVRCYLETSDPDTTGWLAIRYAVDAGSGYYSEMQDTTDTGGSGDDFAGDLTNPVIKFYAYAVRV